MKFLQPKLNTGIFLFFGGLILGSLTTISFLRTIWSNFRPDFFFWVSIVMTIISLVLLCFSIWQYLSVQSERKKGDAQVKIWMEDASGIHQGMRTIAVNAIKSDTSLVPRYSSVTDVGMAIYAMAESAKALYQSLYEERCVTEEEYTAQQKEIGQVAHKQRLEKIRTEN